MAPQRERRTEFIKVKDSITISSFTLITTTTVSTAILATCQQIKDEAEAIITQTSQRYLNARLDGFGGPSPRIEVEIMALRALSDYPSFLCTTLAWYQGLAASGLHISDLPEVRDLHHHGLGPFLETIDYELQEGTHEQGVQALVRFIQRAGKRLLYQESRILSADDQARQHGEAASSLKPTLEIALRKVPGEIVSSIDQTLLWLTRILVVANSADGPIDGISTVIHLLGESIRDEKQRTARWQILCSALTRGQPAIATVNPIVVSEPAVKPGDPWFDEHHKDAYGRLWRACEWT